MHIFESFVKKTYINKLIYRYKKNQSVVIQWKNNLQDNCWYWEIHLFLKGKN